MAGPGHLSQDPGRYSLSHQETTLSHPLGWHPGISSHFLEPPFPSPPSLAHPCPLETYYFAMLCQGPGFPGTHLWPRPVPEEGAWGPGCCLGLGLSSREQGLMEGSPSFPLSSLSLSSLCPSAASPQGLLPAHRHAGVCINLGPWEGALSLGDTLFHCHCAGWSPREVREAGSLESGP